MNQAIAAVSTVNSVSGAMTLPGMQSSVAVPNTSSITGVSGAICTSCINSIISTTNDAAPAINVSLLTTGHTVRVVSATIVACLIALTQTSNGITPDQITVTGSTSPKMHEIHTNSEGKIVLEKYKSGVQLIRITDLSQRPNMST